MNGAAPRYPNIERGIRLLDTILGLPFALVKLALWLSFLGLLAGLWIQIMNCAECFRQEQPAIAPIHTPDPR